MASCRKSSCSFLILFFVSICVLLLSLLRDRLPLPYDGSEAQLSQRGYKRDDDSATFTEGVLVDVHSHGHHSHSLAHSLHRREDYTCAPGRKCTNGACCGASGNCGYGQFVTILSMLQLTDSQGPTYCGTGCTFNCNATAECGQYAAKPGQKCPLNTCCSQYGFCRTASDYCNNTCQSNCVLHPKPPASGGQVLDKGEWLYTNFGGLKADQSVVGYYESWSARSSCHKVAPTDLPCKWEVLLDRASH